MQVIQLVSDDIYYDLTTLGSFTSSMSLVVHNHTSDILRIIFSATQPTPDDLVHDYIIPGQHALVNANGLNVWVQGSTGPIVVYQATERTMLPVQALDYPHDFYTSPKELYRRIKVDPGQTSFHDGREFRTFYEFSILAGQSIYIKADVGVDTILYDVSLVADAGSVRLSTYVGGTPAGTFSTIVPIIPKNTMSIVSQPVYPTQNALSTGGTFTGGTRIDIVRIVAANATAQQTSVGSKSFDQRGVGAGMYYWQLENFSSGTATGTFSGFWAEILNLGV